MRGTQCYVAWDANLKGRSFWLCSQRGMVLPLRIGRERGDPLRLGAVFVFELTPGVFVTHAERPYDGGKPVTAYMCGNSVRPTHLLIIDHPPPSITTGVSGRNRERFCRVEPIEKQKPCRRGARPESVSRCGIGTAPSTSTSTSSPETRPRAYRFGGRRKGRPSTGQRPACWPGDTPIRTSRARTSPRVPWSSTTLGLVERVSASEVEGWDRSVLLSLRGERGAF